MEQFTQEFLAFRDRLEAMLPEAFTERERGVLIAERGCALAAGYSLTSERKIFGVVGTGAFSHCHEVRLLYSVPDLRAETFPDWKNYAQKAIQERIQLDRSHEFSIFSFILAVNGTDRALIRALRRADHYEKYDEPNNGWSQIRFLLADLSARKLYPSPQAKPLLDLMRGVL